MRTARQYGVPFFQVEFQTYEDARKGEWTKLPSYRLVNEEPISPTNCDGFHWRGETYEELLSWTGYVPNQFNRICTRHLELEITRDFLKDWLASRPTIPSRHAPHRPPAPGPRCDVPTSTADHANDAET